MKNIYYTIVLTLFINCSRNDSTEPNYIDNYYPYIYQAELEYQYKHYEKAYELYQIAFSLCKPINTPMYYELGKFARCAAYLGHTDQALDYLELNIRKGYKLSYMTNKEHYLNIFTSQRGLRLIENYDSIHSNYLKTVNYRLRKEIQSINQLDQQYRLGVLANEQDSVDNLNAIRLIEIFDEFGYPNRDVIGHYSVDNIQTDIGTVLLHTNDSIRMHYFVPKLLEFVKKGECPPLRVGQLIDQFHLYNRDPQTHGTYHGQKTTYANMIEDLEQVNENRLSIGLPSLEMEEELDSLRKL